MKLVLFQQSDAGPQLPGLLTDRGVVDISGAVRSSYTPQLVIDGRYDAIGSNETAVARALSVKCR